jgi:hypothetical protein
MYNTNQIQEMLNKLNTNQPMLKTFCAKLEKLNASDRMAIMDVLRDGSVERFDRYDSDVCEQFISLYENVERELKQKDKTEECSKLITMELTKEQETLQELVLDDPVDFEREFCNVVVDCVKKVYGKDAEVDNIHIENGNLESQTAKMLQEQAVRMQNMGCISVTLPDGSVSFGIQFTMPAAFQTIGFENDSLEEGAWEREVEQYESR